MQGRIQMGILGVALVIAVLLLTKLVATAEPLAANSSGLFPVLKPVSVGTKQGAVITVFGDTAGDDNGIGKANVVLGRYKTPVRFNGQRVYPAAVHTKHMSKWLYSVVQVVPDRSAYGLKPIYCHIVDECAANTQSCSKNLTYKNKGFVLDIHSSGMPAMGAKGRVLTTGTIQKVGMMPPSKIPPRLFGPGYGPCPLKGSLRMNWVDPKQYKTRCL